MLSVDVVCTYVFSLVNNLSTVGPEEESKLSYGTEKNEGTESGTTEFTIRRTPGTKSGWNPLDVLSRVPQTTWGQVTWSWGSPPNSD